MHKNLFAIIIALLLSVSTHFAVAIQSHQVSYTQADQSWHQNITLPDGRTIVAMPAEFQIIQVTQIIRPAQVIEKQIPAKTKQVKKTILKSPARTVERVIPAVKKSINRRVIDKPARTQIKTIPQVSKDINITDPRSGLKTKRTIVIQPSYKDFVVIPATYKMIQEQVVVQEKSVEQVTIPAVLEKVTETVVVSEAYVEKITIPAETKVTAKRVEIAPARLVLKNQNGKIIHIFASEPELQDFVNNPLDPEFVYSTSAFQQVTETIVVKPAQTEYQTIPAQLETVNEFVVVQSAATELVVVPATFKTITETIVVQPASVEFTNIPAEFKTEIQTIVVSPTQDGRAAVTKTFKVKKLVRPARTVETTIPAFAKQVTRRVVATPASTMERVIPALTRQETRRVLRRPERVVSREVPAETVTITRWVAAPQISATPGQSWPGLIEDRFVWPTTNTMPFFKPPKTDIKIDIPNATCGYTPNNSDRSLMHVFENFSGLLNRYQYQKRVFKYKHGFAILTSPERISEDAKNILDPKLDTRIKLDQHPINGIGSYLQILFTKPATRYRYLAFIITADDNVESTDSEATSEGLKAIFAEGSLDSDLPSSMRNYAFTKEYKCQVWVYEFSRIDREDPIAMDGDLFVPAAPALSEFAHKAGSPVLKALFDTSPR